jgi:hypothetical protein
LIGRPPGNLIGVCGAEPTRTKVCHLNVCLDEILTNMIRMNIYMMILCSLEMVWIHALVPLMMDSLFARWASMPGYCTRGACVYNWPPFWLAQSQGPRLRRPVDSSMIADRKGAKGWTETMHAYMHKGLLIHTHTHTETAHTHTHTCTHACMAT